MSTTWSEAQFGTDWRVAGSRSADDENPPATPQEEGKGQREKWQQLIDQQLIGWGLDPGQLGDEAEGIPAPSRDILALACQVAAVCRDRGLPPPLCVAPTGTGGISFERRDGSVYESLQVKEDGSVELLTFRNSRLCSRRRLA